MKPDSENHGSLEEQLEQVFVRPSGREIDQMRKVRLEPVSRPHADGSVLASFDDTQVICALIIENNVPN